MTELLQEIDRGDVDVLTYLAAPSVADEEDLHEATVDTGVVLAQY